MLFSAVGGRAGSAALVFEHRKHTVEMLNAKIGECLKVVAEVKRPESHSCVLSLD